MSALKNEKLEVNKQPICNNCKHYIKGVECKAFLLIPDVIIFNENDHSEPLPGQKNDITFTPIDE